MEGEKTKSKRRSLIRLLSFASFCIPLILFSSIASAESSMTTKMEYRCENINDENILFLKFIIENTSFSQLDILLNEHKNILKLKEKKTYKRLSSTILEVQYEICQCGKIILDNIFLLIDNIKIKQDAISVYASAPKLKSNSQFRMKLFDDASGLNELGAEESLVLGEKYLLVIEGFFKREDKDKITITPSFRDNVLIEKNEENIKDLSLDGWQNVYSCFLYPLNSGMQTFGYFSIMVEQGSKQLKFILKSNSFNVLKKEKTEPQINKLQKELEQMLSL